MTHIATFNNGTFKVTRKAVGTYQGGFYMAGSDETLEVTGSMQPTTAAELKLVEEGNRLRQYYKFFTNVPLIPIGLKSLKDSDRIQVDGRSFKVLGVAHHRGLTLSHYVSTVVEEPEQGC